MAVMEKQIAVNRRIGGLESKKHGLVRLPNVNRRIGGLEIKNEGIRIKSVVNRRIGGLESSMCISAHSGLVNRRTGGLESIYSGQWGCIVLMKNNIGCVIIKLYSL